MEINLVLTSSLLVEHIPDCAGEETDDRRVQSPGEEEETPHVFQFSREVRYLYKLMVHADI